MRAEIERYFDIQSEYDPRSFGGLKAGPFLFNDGEWYLFSALEVTEFEKMPGVIQIRLMGVVRSRSLERAQAATKKRFPDKDLYVTCAFKPAVNRWRIKNPTKTLYKAPYRLNRAMCKRCGEVIESFYTHDFKRCSCGKIAVDGGDDYHRRAGALEDIEEMS